MFSGSMLQIEEEAAGKAELPLKVKFARIKAVHRCMKKVTKPQNDRQKDRVTQTYFTQSFVCLFVCLSAGLRKTSKPIFTQFGGKVAHGPRSKRLDFGVIRFTFR